MITEFKTIAAPAEGMYKDKGSRFLAFAFPVKNEDEVRKHLQDVRKEHYQCNHHCYAFRLNPDGSSYRSSDDREPAGSAGKPILNQLLANELTNTLIIVARYFGGSLLGVPGLINAYRSAAADAIANATKIVKLLTHTIELSFPYEKQNDIMHVLRSYHFTIQNESYGEQVRLIIEVPVTESEMLVEKLTNSDKTQNILINKIT